MNGSSKTNSLADAKRVARLPQGESLRADGGPKEPHTGPVVDLVFVAGMARAGSMWTYNVARVLLARHGLKVVPSEMPIDSHELRTTVDEALGGGNSPGESWLLKIHFALPESMLRPSVRVICNIRDVRHALASYMRFTRCDFNLGIAVAHQMTKVTDHYLACESSKVLTVQYQDVLDRPSRVVRDVGAHLGRGVSVKDADAIARQWSRDNVRKQIDSLPRMQADRKSVMGKDQPFKTAPNFDGTVRVVDPIRGFQTGHVGDLRNPDWRSSFSLAQQNVLNRLFGEWLEKHGFAV